MASLAALRRAASSVRQQAAACLFQADHVARQLHSGPPLVVHKRGADLLHDPWFNKSTAFKGTERDRLGLRGLLPAGYQNMQQQIDMFMKEFRGLDHNPVHTEDNPLELQKWRILNRLHDRNETLYYKILIDNIQEMAPIIYTPTVGMVCQKYSSLFRRPRGMYFSASDRGEFLAMCHNWPADQVDMIVVTDGSRILGLGDLGVQGIGIPVGKLDLYVAAAGINPNRVLPIMFDVGTNNAKLLNDPLYLGLKQQRLEGEEYITLVDEFMEAVFTRWPNVIVQFEDFQNKWAFKLLKRYRDNYRTFNDDVQGTAGVVVAGLMNAVRAQGLPTKELANFKIVVLGAGSAGMGVVRMIHQAMVNFLGGGEAAEKQAAKNFYVLDAHGLITQARTQFDEDVVDFMRPAEEAGTLKEGTTLLNVVKTIKPQVLLGLSGVGGLFTHDVLAAMKHDQVKRPAIFALSNPTKNSECSADDVFRILGPDAVFASGSPFPDALCEGGKIGRANQGNNMYLFPGIGLGTLVSGARQISDNMMHRAAETLSMYISDEEVAQGVLFPQTGEIREITKNVAAAVVRSAVEEGLAEGYRGVTPETLANMSLDEVRQYVQGRMWSPLYSPLIYDVERRFKELSNISRPLNIRR